MNTPAVATQPLLVGSLPTVARIFPCLAWEALRAGEVVPYTTWCALGAFDRTGSGRVPVAAARSLIVDWRHIDPASGRRVLRSGEQHGYWRMANAYLYLTSSARLMARFGIERERPPHLVELGMLKTPAAMKAHLFATVYEIPGHDQRFNNAPLARSTKQDLTSVPLSTQRRYDAHASELIQECYAVVERLGESGVAILGGGYFIGRRGRQMRRLADYRVPKGHVPASRTAAKHAARKAAALRERQQDGRSATAPVVISRGFSGPDRSHPTRRFYSGETEAAARKRAGDEAARPRGRPVLGWGKGGQMTFVQIEESL